MEVSVGSSSRGSVHICETPLEHTVAAGARRGGHGVRSAVASAARRSRSRLLAMRRVASRAADARAVRKAR